MVCVGGGTRCGDSPAGWTSTQNLDRHWSLIFLRWHLASAHTHIYVNLELQEDWNVVVLSQVFFCQVEIFKNLLLILFWINSFSEAGLWLAARWLQCHSFICHFETSHVSYCLWMILLYESRRYLPAGNSSGWCLPILTRGEWLIYLCLFWINQFGFFALSITNVICCCYMTLFCCLFWGTR